MGKTERNDIEMYQEWYFNELVDAGYIMNYDREGETFDIFPSYKILKKKYHKTKLPTTELFTLERGMKYSYDYRVFWTVKALNIFFTPASFKDRNNVPIVAYPGTFFYAEEVGRNLWMSLVDVKPPAQGGRGNNNSMDSFVTFPLKQKILLWLHGVYINKVIPIPMKGCGDTNVLFPNTFTPKRYYITDGGRSTRKIKFDCYSLSEYLANRKLEIDTISNSVKAIADRTVKQGELFK